MLYCSQNLKRSVLLSYDYLFYSVLSFCKKASHAFLQNEFFIVTQTFIEAHNTLHIHQLLEKSPLGSGTSHEQEASGGQGVPMSRAAEVRQCLHGHAQSHSPRHLCAHKEHLTTVQRLSFPQQTTPTVLVTAEIPTLGTRKNNILLY